MAVSVSATRCPVQRNFDGLHHVAGVTSRTARRIGVVTRAASIDTIVLPTRGRRRRSGSGEVSFGLNPFIGFRSTRSGSRSCGGGELASRRGQLSVVARARKVRRRTDDDDNGEGYNDNDSNGDDDDAEDNNDERNDFGIEEGNDFGIVEQRPQLNLLPLKVKDGAC